MIELVSLELKGVQLPQRIHTLWGWFIEFMECCTTQHLEASQVYKPLTFHRPVAHQLTQRGGSISYRITNTQEADIQASEEHRTITWGLQVYKGRSFTALLPPLLLDHFKHTSTERKGWKISVMLGSGSKVLVQCMDTHVHAHTYVHTHTHSFYEPESQVWN